MSEPICGEETPQQEYSFTPEKEPSAQQTPPAPAPAVPPAAPRPQRTRRVGTFTMGLSLIAAGVIALLCLFTPSFNIVDVLRFSPLVFIFLGVEILLSHLIFRGDRLKYDFWSGVVCFFLICMSVGAALLPPLYQQYGPGRERMRAQMTRQAESLYYEALKDEKDIQSMRLNLYLNGGLSDYSDATVQSLSNLDDLYLSFSLSGDYANKEQFAGKAREILNRIAPLPLKPSEISFSYRSSDEDKPYEFDLNIGGVFAMNQDAAGLARMVDDESQWDRLEEERERFDDRGGPLSR